MITKECFLNKHYNAFATTGPYASFIEGPQMQCKLQFHCFLLRSSDVIKFFVFVIMYQLVLILYFHSIVLRYIQMFVYNLPTNGAHIFNIAYS